MKPLIYWLVALQLLLSAPVVSAFTSSHGSHCAVSTDHCPCCPDGVVNMADCLSACGAAAAPPPVSTAIIIVIAASEAPVQPDRPLDTVDDPPLKPPPIR